MTEWLIKKFVKDPGNVEDEKVRLSYGMLSSMAGIVCNLILFAAKLIIGTAMSAVSIISDAFNNLSDCLSCVVTLFGYRLAAKPADKEHPFGHGRMEYLVSLVVAMLIFLVGYKLASVSIDRIMHPVEMNFSLALLVVLMITVFVKLWMSAFNHELGTRINNIAMIATSEDSRNDVIVTSVTIVAMLLSRFIPGFPFDGIAGLAVACFIFYSGYEIAKQIVDTMIGKPVSHEMSNEIRKIMLSHKEIIGIHDLVVHDYGPGQMIGSAHAEVDSRMNILEAHDVIDEAEKEIQDQLHIMMTLHMDPIELNNPLRNSYRKEVIGILQNIYPGLSMHDFRMVPGPTHTNLVFDIMVPYDCPFQEYDIKKEIDDKLSKHSETRLQTVITFDRDYTEHDGDE